MFTIRPAVRQNTPLIIGLAGATKTGKTYSAHRLAAGLAAGGKVVMLNAEGARGHQYADKFSYMACDIEAPFRPARYTEAVLEIAKTDPGCLIIDSASHMHDGPGGLLEYHDEEMIRISKGDEKKAQAATWAAWIKPKAEENKFIYTLQSLKCPIILCFRAKEKIKPVTGKAPIDLGWQPIASERVPFETMFTLMLTPHCKGVPDLSISDMREPFDTLIPEGKPIDENLGKLLRQWAAGSTAKSEEKPTVPAQFNGLVPTPVHITASEAREFWKVAKANGKTTESVATTFNDFGYTATTDILRGDFPSFLGWARGELSTLELAQLLGVTMEAR